MVAADLQQQTSKGGKLTLLGLLIVAIMIVLFAMQVYTGTPVNFALLVSLFVGLTCVTVKALGGPTTLQGLSVTILAFQHVIISQFAKAFLGQSAVDRMLVPIETMLVYNLAMFAILCAALVYRLIRVETIKPIFDLELDARRLSIYAVILTIFSLYRFFALQKFGVFEGASGGVYIGGFVGPLRQFGFLAPLAVSCGTAAVIVKSNGRRCMGIWNGLAIIGPILYGIIGAGRQESATSIVTFVLTLYAFKFKLKPAHYGFIAAAFYLLQFIIFPYALYARGDGGVRIGTFEERIVKAANLLMEFAFSPKKRMEEEENNDYRLPWNMQRMNYYGEKIPTLDRYSVILSTDNVVNAVLAKGPKGPDTIYVGFGMLLPRFLNSDKEALGTANMVAQYGDGLVGNTDFMTQITLGFIPEGFYAYSWAGVFSLSFIISLAYFTMYRFFFRSSMFRNVFVVAMMFTATWSYSESTASGQTLLILQTTLYYFLAMMPLALIARSMTKKHRESRFIYERDRGPEQTAPALPEGSS